MVISFPFSLALEDDTSEGTSPTEEVVIDEEVPVFVDVEEGEWYYEAVMLMAQRGIITGYPDKTFRPMAPVLREEFAKMMVKALKLDLVPVGSSFVDVADGYWASSYIETAKLYLTGYIRQGEYLYKPAESAVREDMAVALVKAKNLEIDETMLSALDEYEDADLISDKLRTYMAAAVYHEVMIGYVIDGKKYLKPNESLSRAEASKLIASVITEEEGEAELTEVLIVKEGDFPLEAIKEERGYKLTWSYEEDEEAAFRVIASQLDPDLSYPEDGYTAYIDQMTYDLHIGSSYVNGDFDEFLPGETYYLAVIAGDADKIVTSDIIQIKMPQAQLAGLTVPSVSVQVTDEGLLVKWKPIDHPDLMGFNVVASKTVENPSYPMNGYGAWLPDPGATEYLIRPKDTYSGGDLEGSFVSGQDYYINITAIYNTGTVSGQGLMATMPDVELNPIDLSDKTPKVTASIVDGKVLITWSMVDQTGLQGYMLVASLNNPNPVYNQDGYAYWITTLNTQEKLIEPFSLYKGGDVGGKLLPGETYYFSVTALFGDRKIPGNAIRLTMPNLE